MKKKALYPILALLIGLGIAFWLAVTKPTPSTDTYQPPPITVRVQTVIAATEHLNIASQGSVQPRSQSELIPDVSGRATWVSPSLVDGGSFQAGDVLLRIDDADYLTSLRRSEAALQRAEVETEYAADELRRLQKLHAQQLASQSQLDSARRTSRIAQANLTEGRADLEQAQRDLARIELLAPFYGLVRNEHVDLGQFLSRGQSIGTIYATDYVEVRLPIAADQLGFLGLPVSTRGQIPLALQLPVTVTADFGRARLLWDGLLVRTEAQIDERSRMLYGVARFRIDEEGSGNPIIPVGLFVQAEIRGKQVENIMRLPRSALRDRNQVLVVDAENRLRFRQVVILRLEHDEVLVTSGLRSGERVCVSPLQTVVEGMRVTPESG